MVVIAGAPHTRNGTAMKRGVMQPQPDARRCFAKIGEYRRAKQRLDAVGQADAEDAIGGAGIEGLLA
jgi:hypothetical protein